MTSQLTTSQSAADIEWLGVWEAGGHQAGSGTSPGSLPADDYEQNPGAA
jgi:hypothetical protein